MSECGSIRRFGRLCASHGSKPADQPITLLVRASPNQTITNPAPIDSTNLILTVGSNNSSGVIKSRDVTDLFTLNKSFSNFTITAGVYFNQSRFSRDFAYAGRGVMPLQNNPYPLDVTFTATTMSIGVQKGPPIGVQKGPLRRAA